MMVDASVRAVFRVVFFIVTVVLLYHISTAILFPSTSNNPDPTNQGLGSRINNLGASVWRAGEEKLGWETPEQPPPPSAPEQEEAEEEGHHSYDDTREDGLSEEEAALLESHDTNDSKEKIAIIAEHKDAPKTASKPKVKKPKTKGTAQEIVLQDLKHYTRINDEEKAQQLVVTVAWNSSSWGGTSETPRSVVDYITLLQKSSGLKLAAVSLAVLTTDEGLYDDLVAGLEVYDFAKYQVLLWTPGATSKKETLEAQAKNTLLLRTLETELHVFVLSPGVVAMEKGVLAKILKHGYSGDTSITANSSLVPSEVLPLGVVTALTKPADAQTYLVEHAGKSSYAKGKFGMKELVQWTEDSEVVPLISVGGGLVYLRAELVRLGLVFPTFEIGEETGATGLCYLAESLGAGCYGLGGSWSVEVSS